MVEFAMVLPIFMLVLSGIADFGFALYQRMSVISAAREGARAAAMVADHATIATAAQGAAQAAAVQGGLDQSQLTVAVTCSPHASDCSDAQINDLVTVKTSYPYSSFFPLTFHATFTLESSVQMVLESLGT
jgi:Flp pilus assembly protein TadG